MVASPGYLNMYCTEPRCTAGIRPPRAVGIFVPLEIAIVGRIGIDDDPGSASLLRQVNLHSTEVHAVAGKNDLPGNTDVHLFQLLEILRARVIDIHRVGGHVAGWGGAVKGGQHTRIILVGIVIDVFPAGPGHENFPFAVDSLQKYFLGQIQPGLVGNDLRIEAGSLELARHVDRGIVVLFAGGDVGSGGQRFELFLRQLGIGNRQEILIDLCLPAEVAIAQDTVREREKPGPAWVLAKGQAGNRRQIVLPMNYLSRRKGLLPV